MRGEVHTPGGEIIPLPEFTAWRLIHTDGRSADSFEVRFPTREDLLVRLLRGVNFYAVDGGATVFCGVVDEAEAIWADEYTTTLCGRGLAARLMDNQAGGAQFFNLDMNSVLDRYVRPFGIGQIRVEGGPWRTQMVSVPAGCSCKQVLDGFCRLVGAPQPRFDPDGTLRIARGQGSHILGEEDLLSAKWRLCRYGVITEQQVHDLTTGAVSVVRDPVLESYGIRSRRFATRSGLFTHVNERSARARIAEAARDLNTLELTLPGGYSARCCDTVRLSLPALRAEEDYVITEICRRFDGLSETTRLGLRAKE